MSSIDIPKDLAAAAAAANAPGCLPMPLKVVAEALPISSKIALVLIETLFISLNLATPAVTASTVSVIVFLFAAEFLTICATASTDTPYLLANLIACSVVSSVKSKDIPRESFIPAIVAAASLRGTVNLPAAALTLPICADISIDVPATLLLRVFIASEPIFAPCIT